MNVKSRITSIKLLEKRKKNPEFFKEIGVVTNMKITDSNTKQKEKNSWITEEK